MHSQHEHDFQDFHDHLSSKRPGAGLDLYEGRDADGVTQLACKGHYTAHVVLPDLSPDSFDRAAPALAHVGGLVDYAGPAVVEITPIGPALVGSGAVGLELTVQFRSGNSSATLATAIHIRNALTLLQRAGGFRLREVWLNTTRKDGRALRVAVADADTGTMQHLDTAALLWAKRDTIRFLSDDVPLAVQVFRAVRDADTDTGLSA
ncbi:MAG: hypothetical protein U5L04_09810 [Trueperaceae bacterium]|nr:hypothetical protein [Trueperaceae bacterium]